MRGWTSLVVVLALSAMAPPARGGFVTVDLSPWANARLQESPLGGPTGYTGGISLPDQFTGDLLLGGVPFYIPTSGQNGWHSYNTAGPNPRTLDLPVNQFGVTTVHMLLNTYWGQKSQGFTSLEFFGSNGAYYRKDLVGNVDIRDYNEDVWTNSINGLTTIEVISYQSFAVAQRIDKLQIDLPSAFQDQTLLHMRLSDAGGGEFHRAFLAGVTVETPSTVPEPGAAVLISVGGIGLFGYRWLRRTLKGRPA